MLGEFTDYGKAILFIRLCISSASMQRITFGLFELAEDVGPLA